MPNLVLIDDLDTVPEVATLEAFGNEAAHTRRLVDRFSTLLHYLQLVLEADLAGRASDVG